jgi:ABC-type phosphate/phosphonate transport system substrate-binding protein
MKKMNFLFLALAFVSVLSISCSSTKKSSKKGGGWYKNRNVNQLIKNEKESIVYQIEEDLIDCLSKLE